MTLSLLTGALLGETSDAIATMMVMTAPMAAVAGWILLSGRYRSVPQHPTRQPSSPRPAAVAIPRSKG